MAHREPARAAQRLLTGLWLCALGLGAARFAPAGQETAPASSPAPASAAPASAEPAAPAGAVAQSLPLRLICPDPSDAVALGSAQWNGWGRDAGNSRYQPEPALRVSDVPRLALRWAFGYPGEGVAGQPTVADGRVFVAAPTGRIYALDAKLGCTYWSYEVGTGVRTAMIVGESAPPRAAVAPRHTRRPRHKRSPAHLEVRKAPSALYFADEHGTVYALDTAHGTLLWKSVVETHPLALIEATPVLFQNRLYVATASREPDAIADPGYACCTFRGSVAALDTSSGRLLFKTYLVTPEPQAITRTDGQAAFGPAGAAVLSAPTIDVERGLLYVATGRVFGGVDQPAANAIVAIGLEDGAVRWTRQPGPHSGEAGEFVASPLLRIGAHGQRFLITAQRSGVVYSLDPDRQGEIVWQSALTDGKHEARPGWALAADHRSLYVPLTLGHPPQESAGLVALDLRTGAHRWEVQPAGPACAWGSEGCAHGQSQAITVAPGVAFVGARDGHLRAYSTIDGKVLWDTDTAHPFATVNGVPARGGSLDRGGAVIVNGLLYVNSGAAGEGEHAGNVLLAYSAEAR